VRAISAGAAHACAIVGDERAVYCWGDNEFGQLANADAASFSTAPLPVAGELGGTSRSLIGAAQISAGARHTCAVLEDGRVVCWGESQAGRLGAGPMDAGNGYPVLAARFVDFPPYGKLLTPVKNAVQVAAGEEHTCLRTIDGTVECWGSNAYGQLGADKSVASSDTPRPVGGLSQVEQLSLGRYHGCALVAGRVWCWGLNKQQQLGRAPSDTDYVPTPIERLPAAQEVAAGGAFTCARTAVGIVHCWGENDGAQQGFLDPPAEDPASGTSLQSPATVRLSVVPLPAVVQLAASDFVCARTATEVFCWGYDRYGQLGRGTMSIEPDPVPKRIRSLAGSTP
jgi:alpha-tubulin suppressor-like RCC1 family protein